MSFVEQVDNLVTKFSDKSIALSDKFTILSEIQDLLDGKSGNDFELCVNKIIPSLISSLNEITISFDENSNEHKLRHNILELLNSCFSNQLSEDQVNNILDCLLTILPKENEENGIICMKISTILFKSFKNILQEKVEQFICIIIQCYKNSRELVNKEFDQNSNTLSNDIVPLKNPLAQDLLDTNIYPLNSDFSNELSTIKDDFSMTNSETLTVGKND